MYSKPPKFYSLVKIHKKECPICPLVFYNNASYYRLSKESIKTIYKYYFKPKYSLNNSLTP